MKRIHSSCCAFLFLITLALPACLPPTAVINTKVPPPTLPTVWRVDIEDNKHRHLGALTLEISNLRATSCTGTGDTPQFAVKVVSREGFANPFVIADQPVAYFLNGSVVIDLNVLCDAGTELQGKLIPGGAKGKVAAVSMFGDTYMGYFNAVQQ